MKKKRKKPYYVLLYTIELENVSVIMLTEREQANFSKKRLKSGFIQIDFENLPVLCSFPSAINEVKRGNHTPL